MKLKHIVTNTKKIITGNSYKHYKKFKTYDNVYMTTAKCIIWGILGLFLGIIINDIVIYLINKFKIINKLIQNILHIVLCAITVAGLHSSHNFLGWTLHNTMPGIFFITLLFNAQFKMDEDIQSSYIIYNNNNNNDNDKK